MTHKEVMQQALDEILKSWQDNPSWPKPGIIDALRAAIAQPESEPDYEALLEGHGALLRANTAYRLRIKELEGNLRVEPVKSGEREALIAEARRACIDGSYAQMADLLTKCADMLEADTTIDESMAQGPHPWPESKPSDYEIHKAHCFQAPYETTCKFGDEDCPMAAPVQPEYVPLTDMQIDSCIDHAFGSVFDYGEFRTLGRAIEQVVRSKS